MVQAHWNVGRLIVEHEQKGRRRAGYGEAIIATLAERLTRDLGRGFDERNLRYMRSFHLAFPILNALRDDSPGLRAELSWTHYRLLLSVDDAQAREWYMQEAAEQQWSTRQLERQISVGRDRSAMTGETVELRRLMQLRIVSAVRRQSDYTSAGLWHSMVWQGTRRGTSVRNEGWILVRRPDMDARES